MTAPKYFLNPFGVAGTKAAIPEAVQSDGTVSYTEGFGIDYQLDPGSDPDALDIPRDKFNELMYEVTLVLQYYFQNGFPPWISSSDNGGTPYAYGKECYVKYTDGLIYRSLVNANTAVPGTDPTAWQLFPMTQLFSTADVVETFDTTLPSGWLWLDGRTIGSATSGATGRANADTLSLYTVLWNSCPNSALIIQTNLGAPTTRGVSAASDFAANKRLPVPDKRGKVSAGLDNMGGTAAGLLTNVGAGNSGIAGSSPAATGGIQTVQLTANQNGTHNHSGTTGSDGIHQHSLDGLQGAPGGGLPPPNPATIRSSGDAPVVTLNGGFTDNDGAHNHAFTTSDSGSGDYHQNCQPTLVSLFRIKL